MCYDFVLFVGSVVGGVREDSITELYYNEVLWEVTVKPL